ncbi:MAG: M20/M25/M40 family metallo-hydrolase [Calditrichaeota bacterium]|nr:MAG: M20/M25/M40 family metallo-hydrolase [Calditrichota bacterium]
MARIRWAVLWLMMTILVMAQSTEPVDLQMITRIKQEGLKRSQVMEILSYLTDVYGPRLTGSPQLRKAEEWCRDKLAEWGLQNAHLESWGTFGRGWETVGYRAEMVEPVYMNLIAHPKAWTAGTDSVVRGQPLMLDIEDAEKLEEYREKVKGAIVLLGGEAETETHFEADASRRTEEDLQELWEAPTPRERSPYAERWRRRREEYRKRRQLRNFLAEAGVGVILEPSSIEHGTLRVMSGGSRNIGDPPGPPALVVAKEQYNRIVRLLKKEIPVILEISIENRFYTEDSLGYNVIAEIPGMDRRLKNEVVMVGAHIDSWHGGTGATDNAAGCAVMMEAVRILQAIGVKPRRTIRIALWSGEEQGLLGSRGYVKQHFGDPETREFTAEHARFSAYYNLDNGSGKIRGIYLQENDAARPIFEAFFRPFHDMGATTVTIRNTGGTDHLSFDAVGLPGFQFIQDPLDYFSRTWHTNMDVYDHAIAADLMHSAVIVASIVYHTAQRKDKIPRKPLPPKEAH